MDGILTKDRNCLTKLDISSFPRFLISGNDKFDKLDGILEKVGVNPQHMDSIPNKLGFRYFSKR